jgi:hypothetical protein
MFYDDDDDDDLFFLSLVFAQNRSCVKPTLLSMTGGFLSAELLNEFH